MRSLKTFVCVVHNIEDQELTRTYKEIQRNACNYANVSFELIVEKKCSTKGIVQEFNEMK